MKYTQIFEHKSLSKRKVIQFIGATLTTLLVPPIGSYAKKSTLRSKSLYRWRGNALGTDASILIEAEDEIIAKNIFHHCQREIVRLENIFSLYLPTSALTRLNRDGEIKNTPPELLELVSECIRLGGITNGAFDITVQSLWRLYAAYFSAKDPNNTGPNENERADALMLVDYSKINITSHEISFGVPDMSITLNGIAPGYITDKLTNLLYNYGITNALVDIGETRTLGQHPSNRPWEIGIVEFKNPGKYNDTVVLNKNNAIASSSRHGMFFDSTGHSHHLFDRFTGKSAMYNNGVTVVAPTAVVADALSTAFSVMPRDKVESCIGKFSDIEVIISAL
jgi:thiamine biosynthesis lipoprotein